jgi:putative PIN family toxin of toxin-antitoxin system
VRILLDTNILVSALLTAEGAPARLLQGWLDGFFELVSSDAQLRELRRVLSYPRIRERITADQATDILESLAATAILAAPGVVAPLSGDPDDEVLLAAAIAGGADLIVSGDRSHMLPLRSAGGIPIVSAQDALARLGL